MFSPSCPAAAVTTGCLPSRICCVPSKLFWTVVVPWERFLSEGWTAPGGNRYWARNVPASGSDPVVASILRTMAARSMEHFQSTFVKSEYKNKKMKDVLQEYAGKLTTNFGIVTVPLQPNPEETAEAFVQRGGFLLWIDPETGPYAGARLLQSYWAEWMTRDVVSAQLYGKYDPTQGILGYSIRLEYKGGWDKLVQNIGSKISSYAAKFCAKATGAEAATIIGVLAPIAGPAATPYVAAWGAVAGLCNWPSTPATPCTPPPPDPSADSKVIPFAPSISISGGGKSSFSVPVSWAITPAMTASTTAPPSTGPFTPIPENVAWYQAETSAKAVAGVSALALLGGLAIAFFRR